MSSYYLPPLTTPLVQMADMEIPVKVVTTTLRPITMIPRPERSEKKSVFKYIQIPVFLKRRSKNLPFPRETRADQL